MLNKPFLHFQCAYIIHCILYIIYSILNIIYHISYIIYHILYIIYFKLYIMYYILYIIYFKLYIMYYILYIIFYIYIYMYYNTYIYMYYNTYIYICINYIIYIYMSFSPSPSFNCWWSANPKKVQSGQVAASTSPSSWSSCNDAIASSKRGICFVTGPGGRLGRQSIAAIASQRGTPRTKEQRSEPWKQGWINLSHTRRYSRILPSIPSMS